MAMRRLRLVDPAQFDGGGQTPPSKGGHMRIAVATQDRQRVDAHFASAKTFMFFDVSSEGHTFLEAIQFDTVSDQSGQHQEDGEDRLAAKIGALEGSAMLFVRAIGGPAAARVIRAKVHPVKLPVDEPIADVIERIRSVLKGTPPPWMRKILRDAEAGDERFIDDEN